MSLYKEFSTLLPYIQSVRKIKTYLSFDVSFPNTWKLPKKFVQEDKVIEQTSTITGERLFSFISEIDEQTIELTSKNLQNIIKYNLEREEKEKLFESKVSELKEIFDKQELRSLKNLKFDLNKNKIEFEDDDEKTRLVGE
jgi:cysteinyl-tRNA synthetase